MRARAVPIAHHGVTRPILISRFGSTNRFLASFKHRSMAKYTTSLGEWLRAAQRWWHPSVPM